MALAIGEQLLRATEPFDLKYIFPTKGFVETAAKGVDIRAGRHVLRIRKLLGGHIGRCTHDGSRVGKARNHGRVGLTIQPIFASKAPHETEVSHLNIVVFIEKKVVRFEIAMHEPRHSSARMDEGVATLHGEACGFGLRYGPLGDTRCEATTTAPRGHIVHKKYRHGLDDIEGDGLNDVGMIAE